jgi:hypothetical protein
VRKLEQGFLKGKISNEWFFLAWFNDGVVLKIQLPRGHGGIEVEFSSISPFKGGVFERGHTTDAYDNAVVVT